MSAAASDTRYTLEALAGYYIGNVIIFTLPLYIGGLMDGLGIDESRAGLVSSLELGAIAVACVLFSGWLGKLSLRTIGIAGVCLAMAGNLMCLSQDQFAYIAACRMLSGTGAGMCLAASSAIISRAADPNRVAGTVLAVNTMLIMITLTAISYARQDFLFDGIVAVYLLALIVGFFPLLMLPRQPAEKPIAAGVDSAGDGTSSYPLGVFGVVLLTMFCMMEGSIWSFSERSATHLGLSDMSIGSLLAIGQLCGLAGASIAAVAGSRLRREIPFIVGGTMLGVTGYLIYNTEQQIVFQASLLVFSFSFFFALPYLIGACAQLDEEGRWAARANGFTLVGAAVAPLVAGIIITDSGYAELGLFILGLAVVFCIAAIAFSLRMLGFERRPCPPTAGQ